MEIRKGKIINGTSGGTATKGSSNYKASLPSAWIKTMFPHDDNKEIELCFDGDKIIISKKQTAADFARHCHNKGHKVKILKFYSYNSLCTTIAADFTDKAVRVENHTSKIIKTAFGNKTLPTWVDFTNFLQERCVPASRDGFRHYIKAIASDSEDPLDIIKITQGRMAEDEQWLSIEEVQ